MPMIVKNNAPRLISIQVPSGTLTLAPLSSTPIEPGARKAVQAALDGPLAAFVASGELVTSGVSTPKAETPKTEPKTAAASG